MDKSARENIFEIALPNETIRCHKCYIIFYASTVLRLYIDE